jgi:hypothetical protein
MGDNVTFNAALANDLGVPLGKCIPHALNLIVKSFFKKMPEVGVLTNLAGSIMKAGGSAKRCAQWELLGLDPNKAITYANRFASVLINAMYRVEKFAVIKVLFFLFFLQYFEALPLQRGIIFHPQS